MELLIKRVLDTLAQVGGSSQVALLSVRDEDTCVIDGGFCNGDFIETGHTIAYRGTPLERVIKMGEAGTYPCVLRDTMPMPVYRDSLGDFECLCLPLLDESGKTVIGVALIAQTPDEQASDYRLHMLNMLRTLVSAAMENARLFQLATMDSLTGLYMRRYFEIRLQEEMRRVHRHGDSLCLLMADIDHFKQINDTYGHQQGDHILQEVAEIIRASLRTDIDLPCRYGGEEFIVLLPATPLQGAYIVAERIRQRCEERLFHTSENTIRVTLSLGIAEMDQACNLSKEELIQRTDLMLYAAKHGGRNRVMQYIAEEIAVNLADT
jgi:two-component system, cell cycle response regulator